MTTPGEVLDEIGHDLAGEHPDVERGRIFRSTGFKVRGKYFAFANDDGIVLKLPEARVRALLDAGRGTESRPAPGSCASGSASRPGPTSPTWWPRPTPSWPAEPGHRAWADRTTSWTNRPVSRARVAALASRPGDGRPRR